MIAVIIGPDLKKRKVEIIKIKQFPVIGGKWLFEVKYKNGKTANLNQDWIKEIDGFKINKIGGSK